ncbi:MAG: helicase-related protein [Candidatus Nitrosocosmicus sp.]
MTNNNFIKKDDEGALYTHKIITPPPSSQRYAPSISLLNFPFELKEDQIAAVNAWMNNDYRGTILYSTGTGKTEIAFECAKRLASLFLPSGSLSSFANASVVKDADDLPSKDKNNDFLNKHANPNTSTSSNDNSTNISYSFFNILFLVPRISLIDQTINRLISYGIPKENVAAFFGERKEIAEIVVSTYHSVIKNVSLIRRSNMVIFDEVHLIRDTSKSFSKIFDFVVEDSKKAILGLTATLDKKDFKNNTILSVLPPVIEYNVKKAVKDKRLAKPVIIPIKVSLTDKELKEYETYSTKIKNISNKFKRYDANSMTDLLKKGGFVSGMAKAWFSNVRKRKLLLSCAENKLSHAANIISKKFPNEKIMVFSETVDSIEKLSDLLKTHNIESKVIDAKIKTNERQTILNNWGTSFNVLLSVHTLEIGYDVPQVRIEIILATTSNINQVIQRIGRVLRKYEGKNIALIYVIYIPDTKDDNVIEVVQKAVEEKEDDRVNEILKYSTKNDVSEKEELISLKNWADEPNNNNNNETILPKKETELKNEIKQVSNRSLDDKREQLEKKVRKAYTIIESSLQNESFIVEHDNEKNSSANSDVLVKAKESKIYRVKSSTNKDKFYQVDLEKMSCTCADFTFRHVKCKHIIATEIILP